MEISRGGDAMMVLCDLGAFWIGDQAERVNTFIIFFSFHIYIILLMDVITAVL